MYGGYPGYPPPAGGHPPAPLGYGPPPGSFPPPGAPPYAATPPPIGYGPPPGAAAPVGYGQPPPGPRPGYPGIPPAPMGYSQPPAFVPQGAPMGGGPAFPPPSGPRHIGLGAPGAPGNLPAPNAVPMSIPGGPNALPLPPRPAAAPVHTGEVFRLFVGSIAEGVDDAWLEQVLACAGPVVSIKRMRDANGKPKGFGFAEYGSAESVWRCLNLINGAQLPVSAGKDGFKALVINVDEKTKERVTAWEKSRTSTENDGENDKKALDRLDGITSQMKDPSVVAALADDMLSEGRSRLHRPTHLQDLAPEDLPEESRGMITKEIQFFREQAFKRENSKREERETKINSGYYNQSGGGPATPAQSSQQHGRQGSPASQRAADRGWGTPRGGAANGAAPPRGPGGSAGDPQSLHRPVGFVRAGGQAAPSQPAANGSAAPELTDEEEAKLRADRRRQQAFSEYRERERRWLNRERQRGQAVARDVGRERAQQMEDSHRKGTMAERMKAYDDEQSNELFVVDRARWRHLRRLAREREEASDRADARQEKEEEEAAKRASEAFLREQDEAFKRMAEASRRAGVLQLDEGTPIKLNFGAVGVRASAGGAGSAPAAKKEHGAGGGGAGGGGAGGGAGVLLGGLLGEDDDEYKRKRELIPLTYDDDDAEMEDAKLTQEQLVERENAKVRKLVAAIPSDKETLFKAAVHWDRISEFIIDEKLRPFANKKIVEYLGLQEDELVEAIVKHVKARKGAQALVDELEPVLAEEAEEFAIKFWRMLLYEIAAVEAGVKTSLM